MAPSKQRAAIYHPLACVLAAAPAFLGLAFFPMGTSYRAALALFQARVEWVSHDHVTRTSFYLCPASAESDSWRAMAAKARDTTDHLQMSN